MMLQISYRAFTAFLILACLTGMAPARVRTTPSRDHLTPQEADLVRDAQTLDKRTAIFIKAAERRLLLLTDSNAAASRQAQKDVEKWGELPKGTRAELLGDVAKILDEASTNVDDVSMRDEKNPLIPKALRMLAAASTRFVAQLVEMRARAADGEERDALEQAIENAQSIIAAADKLQSPRKQ